MARAAYDRDDTPVRLREGAGKRDANAGRRVAACRALHERDDYLLREMIAAFEKETGIDVLEVGDTEATKTVGLYTRLVDEKDAPRADVWWSNEPFYTVRLAEQGVLEPYESVSGERSFPCRLARCVACIGRHVVRLCAACACDRLRHASSQRRMCRRRCAISPSPSGTAASG